MQRVWTAIETVLRRYPWAITLAALIPCAYFDAVGINHLVASSLFKADVDTLTRPAPAPPPGAATATPETPTHHVRDTNQILARNIFDSDAGCLNCAPVDAGAGDAAPGDGGPSGDLATPTGPPEPCTGPLKVTGAVEVEDPLWSFVFVSAGANQPALPYRVGQTLETKTVSIIGWQRGIGAFVVLRSGATRCFYAQFMPPRAAPPPPAATATATPAAAAGGLPGELAAALDQGIQRSGDNEFSVRRSLVDRILENQAELMRTTRIMPQSQGGRVVGVQMFGVGETSLLGRLGMRNGDTLNRINGLDIATPDRALEAYSRLRTADHIQLSVTRNGQPVNLDFNIH